MNNNLPLSNPKLSAEDIVDKRIRVFRDKWLPQDDKVKEALKIHAGGEPPSRDELIDIVKKLAEDYIPTEKAAYIDSSSGHLNRNAFDAAMRHIVNEDFEAQKAGKPVHPTTVVFLDLNYLKQLNDVIGYTGGGDKAIEYLSDYITKKLRKPGGHTNTPEGDMFVRFGGDEFGIIMKECTPEQAEAKIRPIIEEIARESIGKDHPFIAEQNRTGVKLPVQLSAAFGCALLRELPEEEKTGSHEQDIKKIITMATSHAQAIEKDDKLVSKAYAASIKGGIPKADDREKAEDIVKPFLEKQFEEGARLQLFADAQQAEPAIRMPAMMSARRAGR